jgi:hypothetical protein
VASNYGRYCTIYDTADCFAAICVIVRQVDSALSALCPVEAIAVDMIARIEYIQLKLAPEKSHEKAAVIQDISSKTVGDRMGKSRFVGIGRANC